MARPRSDKPTYKLVERGSRFYVRWWEDGAWQRVSTGTTDSREAKRFLAQFEAGRGTPAPPAAPTVNIIIDGYLADRQPVVRAYPTLVAAAKPLRRHLGDLEPDHLTKERIRFYMARRRAEGHMVGPADAKRKKPTQDGTIIRELVMLRSALKLAVQEKWIDSAPHIEAPRQPAPRDRWLTREEADRLITSAVAPHVRLFLQLALYTAARAAALLDLQWPAVDFAGDLIDLGSVSGGKSRSVVPMGPKLKAALLSAREIATCPFVIEHGGRSVASVKTGTRAAAVRAGLPGVTPHILRHTAATWMAQRGVAMRDIAKYLGHGDTRITERTYAKHSPEWLRAAAAALEG